MLHFQAHTPFVIRSYQWVVAGESRHVQMVFDDHDVSHLEVLIEASCSIGQDHRLYTEQLKYPHGQSDLVRQNLTIITLCRQEDFIHTAVATTQNSTTAQTHLHLRVNSKLW